MATLLKEDVFIAAAVRSPIASFRGTLASTPVADLGGQVVKEAIRRSGVEPAQIEELLLGNVLSAGVGQNPARQVAEKAGLPRATLGVTINKVCSSSLKALHIGALEIAAGARQVVAIAGVESMSRVPYYLPRGDTPYGGLQLTDGVANDGLLDASENKSMGLCAEKTVKDNEITREQQDAFAIRSYERATDAWKSGRFASEVIAVQTTPARGKQTETFAEDDEPKKLVADRVPTLRPVFSADGTITPANASSLNDGAAAAVLVSGATAKSLNLKPLARVEALAEHAEEPVDFTIAPVGAVKKLLAAASLTPADIAVWEVNEAFAVTALAFARQLGIDAERLNRNGGAVALGHPLGMSGVRIVGAAVHQLKPGERAVATICNGGGEATAVLLRRL